MAKPERSKKRPYKDRVCNETLVETLEPRLLLSADALGAALPGALDPNQTPEAVVSVIDSETAAAIDRLFSSDSTRGSGAATAAAPELIIIDASVEDYEDLVAGLIDLDRDRFDVAIIDSARDGTTLVKRPTLEVADIFRAHGPHWRQVQAGHLSLGQLQEM